MQNALKISNTLRKDKTKILSPTDQNLKMKINFDKTLNRKSIKKLSNKTNNKSLISIIRLT